jgi:flagellar basal body-associated protein FliL
MEEEHQVEQEQQPSKWTVGDRLVAIFVIVMVLAIVIIAICSYTGAFGWNWEWTGLTKPKQRTFWNWLSLLIVPIVLALGGYLFTRSENRRAQDIAKQQRALDQKTADQRTNEERKITDDRRRDDLLQAYLDQIGQLLLDKDPPLRQAKEDDEARTLARARTLTVLPRLDGERKRSVPRVSLAAQ